jgi:hypothetical protein
VDHCTHWPETFPLPDITKKTVFYALLSSWISHFGLGGGITTDQGHQFKSQLFHCLAKLCDIKLCRTSLHFANGHVEHLHHKLKAAIMCHEPALSDPGSTPFIPRHIHRQGTPRLNTRPTMAGHCTPSFGPTMHRPKVTACCTEITFKIMGAASRSPCQQTVSILHTFWK